MLMEALASSEVVSLRGKSSIPDWPGVCGREWQLCHLRLVCGLPSETLRDGFLFPNELDEDAGD